MYPAPRININNFSDNRYTTKTNMPNTSLPTDGYYRGLLPSTAGTGLAPTKTANTTNANQPERFSNDLYICSFRAPNVLTRSNDFSLWDTVKDLHERLPYMFNKLNSLIGQIPQNDQSAMKRWKSRHDSLVQVSRLAQRQSGLFPNTVDLYEADYNS
jgi:hypothetical protein